MNEPVTSHGESYVSVKKQQIAAFHIFPVDLFPCFDLVFGISGNLHTEPPENCLDQTGAIETGRRNSAPEVRDTEEFAKIYSILDELEPAESDEEGFRPVAEYFYVPLSLALLIAGAVAFAALPGFATAVRRQLNTRVSHG